MILYGSSLSPYVRKVLAFAGEKGIELELEPTGFPNHSIEFLEASPFRKMPALRDGPVQAFSEGLHVANLPLVCQVADTAAAIPRVIRATSSSPVTYGGIV